MNSSGDAAEQVVRMSLEGVEVAAKITGSAAKDIALILTAILKSGSKSKGKARLGSMIKSGKELKVFSLKQKDLKKFSKEAKRYGVLYSVLKEKGNKHGESVVDVIARAEDASKISRIIERFNLATVDKASVVRQEERAMSKQGEKEMGESKTDDLIADVLGTEKKANPQRARAEKDPLSMPNSSGQDRADLRVSMKKENKEKKPSVRKKLEKYRKERNGKVQDKVRTENERKNTPKKKAKRSKER